jgi:hypothetical protein
MLVSTQQELCWLDSAIKWKLAPALNNMSELVEKVVPDADNFEPKSFDNHNTSQVLLPKNDAHMLGTAVTWKLDTDGNPIACSNCHPIFDIKVYKRQFPNSCVEEFVANIIAKSLYSQVDSEGQ